MANSPVDRDKNYMKEVWGTTSLTSDYWSLPRKTEDPEERVIQEISAELRPELCRYPEERVIQEIMHDDLKTGQKNLQE